jgi:hypothetical protein
MKNKEFLISFLIFLPLGAILGYINYKSSKDMVLTNSILFGFVGGLGVFFVPFIYRKLKKKDK